MMNYGAVKSEKSLEKSARVAILLSPCLVNSQAADAELMRLLIFAARTAGEITDGSGRS